MAEKAKQALHALLAVEPELKGEFDKILAEGKKTFKDKSGHFDAHHRTLKMKDASRQQEEAAGEDHKAMVTTVPAKLEYTGQAFKAYIDAVLQKELTNQKAKADLVIDGEVVLKDAPATFLLALENKLKYFRAMAEEVPTWAPGIEWKADEGMGKGVYKAQHPETALKTEQIIKPQVLYPATDKHPAQVDKLSEQVPVGLFVKVRWTGTVSPAQKSDLLGEIDKIIRYVKQARMSANETQIEYGKVAEKLFERIMKSLG